MVSYISVKQKIMNFINKQIIPVLQEKDLDYDKTINWIAIEVGASKGQIENIIQSLIATEKLSEHKEHSLTISNIDEWVEKRKEQNKNIKETVKEAEKIIGNINEKDN